MTEQSRNQQPEEVKKLIFSLLVNPEFGFIQASRDFQDRYPVAADIVLKMPSNGKEFCVGYKRHDFDRVDYFSPDFWQLDHVNIYTDPTSPGRCTDEGVETDFEELSQELSPLGISMEDIYFQVLQSQK